MDYKNLNEREKNELANQYRNLVVKLTHQYCSQCQNSRIIDWQQIESMAWEGFSIAINTYDENRSKMNFTQFAAYAIRNNILHCLDEEMRTVKLSAYAQKKAVERGETTWNSVSIDTPINDDDSKIAQDVKFGIYENAKFSDGDVFDYLFHRLETEFSERDCQIFYMSFGLNGYEEPMKGIDVAKQFNVSPCLISQKIKKMTSWIRKDTEICEMLQNLL